MPCPSREGIELHQAATLGLLVIDAPTVERRNIAPGQHARSSRFGIEYAKRAMVGPGIVENAAAQALFAPSLSACGVSEPAVGLLRARSDGLRMMQTGGQVAPPTLTRVTTGSR